MHSNRILVLLTLVALAVTQSPSHAADDFTIDWRFTNNDGYWLGPHVWGNRLHDWQVKGDRLECIASQTRLGMRTAHLLSRGLSDRKQPFSMEVQTGVINNKQEITESSATGFLVGVGGKTMHPWSAAIVHQWPGPGAGYFCGLTSDGRAFIRDYAKPKTKPTPKLPKVGEGPAVDLKKGVTLKLSAKPQAGDRMRLVLTVVAANGKTVGKAEKVVSANRLIGNVALVSHPGRPFGVLKTGRYWFRKWKVAGKKLDYRKGMTFGPIVGTQYTLSRGVLKLTVQMAPLGKKDNQDVELHIKSGGKWKFVAKSKIIIPGWTAQFRVPNWNDKVSVPYSISYEQVTKSSWPVPFSHSDRVTWDGTIRKDPVDKQTITVAGFTGNHNNAGFIGSPRTNWETGMFYPHADVTKSVAKHKPDLLFFSGDQVYEGRSPTFADRANIKLDYLYKWYLWCLAYRHLTKDIPAITMPDDHDVYQGNIWGQGGRKSPGRDHHGGYVHPADFVKMVERTQTSHLPDPFDPTPVGQGIGVYYSHLVWGRISIAILEDRKFKSGCARPDMPKSGTGRPDHFNNPKFDISKLDIKGVELLGKRQEKFLKAWGTDWKGADMKMAVSQTIFANMATHHGPGLQYLIADLDSNGWPQSGRNRAVDALRKAFAFHLAGDQHLATIVHHGIKDHGDAIWSFCVPSVANFYPRAWAPEAKGKYVYPKPSEYLGKRRDGFNHPVTVYAATNPGKPTGKKPAILHDRMPGYGIVKLNKKARTIRMECWPRWADPSNPKHKPYFGWPKTISQMDNYRRRPVGYLPTINVKGMTNPVVQVIDEKTRETVYAVRILGTSFKPFVFAKGQYTVRVGELGTKRVKVLKGLTIAAGKSIEVDLSDAD